MPSHPNCVHGDIYVHGPCLKPSGRECIEDGCTDPAGTLWGPLWCPMHDVERLDRIEQNLRAMRL